MTPVVSPAEVSLSYEPGVTLAAMMDGPQFQAPNNPLTAAVMRCLASVGQVHPHSASTWVKDSGLFRISRPDPNFQIELSSPSSLFEQIQSNHLVTMDVAALLLSLGTYANHEGVPAILSLKDVLSALHISNWGERRQDIAEEIRYSIMFLTSLKLSYRGLPNERRTVQTIDSDSLVSAVPVEDSLSAVQYPDKWLLHLGKWSDTCLKRKTRGSVHWVASIPPVLFELDWRSQRPAEYLAKKIGWIVRVFPGGTAIFTEDQQRFRVQKLLELIGELPSPPARDKDWPGRTRKRLESALSLLREKGVFTKAQYERPPTESRYWSRAWLQSNLVFSTRPQPDVAIAGE